MFNIPSFLVAPQAKQNNPTKTKMSLVWGVLNTKGMGILGFCPSPLERRPSSRAQFFVHQQHRSQKNCPRPTQAVQNSPAANAFPDLRVTLDLGCRDSLASFSRGLFCRGLKAPRKALRTMPLMFSWSLEGRPRNVRLTTKLRTRWGDEIENPGEN